MIRNKKKFSVYAVGSLSLMLHQETRDFGTTLSNDFVTDIDSEGVHTIVSDRKLTLPAARITLRCKQHVFHPRVR